MNARGMGGWFSLGDWGCATSLRGSMYPRRCLGVENLSIVHNSEVRPGGYRVGVALYYVATAARLQRLADGLGCSCRDCGEPVSGFHDRAAVNEPMQRRCSR